MNKVNPPAERAKLEQAVAAQEGLRGVVDDAVVDAAIAALQDKLARLDEVQAPEQQRKFVTVLFMDTVDSTAMTRTLDPEDNLEIMGEALRRMSIPVEKYGGRVIRDMGDGFLAVFGFPLARENEPEMAVRAGLGILDASRRYARDLTETRNISAFQVRVGINTGWVAANRQDETEGNIMGTTVNLAARLESAAPPGGLLISDYTYKHVQGIFNVEPHEPVEAKGFPEPVPVHRVLGVRPRSLRSGRHGVEGIETSMIGRADELETLQQALHNVIEKGWLHTVTVIGEAGVGKTRLLDEFGNWIVSQPANTLLLKGQARLETQGVPYALLRDLFALRFEIMDDDPAEIARNKLVEGFLEPFSGAKDEVLKAHVVGQLLGFDFSGSPFLQGMPADPEQSHDRALMYMTEFFKSVSDYSSVVIVLEDLQWADDSSLDALSRLVLSLSDHSFLCIFTARHVLLERRPSWGEVWESDTRLELVPLSTEVSEQLVDEILQKVERTPENLRKLVVGNAEGNPFYIEELIKVLVDDGVILKTEPFWRVHQERLAGLRVPQTLTGVLQARLDGLPPDERTVMQQAAVVGRVFWDATVTHINLADSSGLDEATVHSCLKRLREREMIYRHEITSLTDAKESIFKHAMLRDATYESVPKQERRRFHALAADWLIAQGGERADEFVGLIADHLERAERNTDALKYLIRAAKAAMARYANSEAVEYYSRALSLLEETNLEGRYAVLRGRESAYKMVGKPGAQRQDLASMELLAEELDSADKQVDAALRMASFFNAIDDYPAAMTAARQAVARAAEIGDRRRELVGQLRWASALLSLSEFSRAHERLSVALALARELGDPEGEARALYLIAASFAGQGDVDASVSYAEEIVAIAREVGDRRLEVGALFGSGLGLSVLSDFDAALDYGQRCLQVAREIGFRQGEAKALIVLADAARRRGEHVRALGYGEELLSISREISFHRGEWWALRNLGLTTVALGRYATAQNHLEMHLSIAQEIGSRWLESMALDSLGLLHLHMKSPESALSYGERAVALVDEIGTRDWEALFLVHAGRSLLALLRHAESEAKFQDAFAIGIDLGRANIETASRSGLAQAALASERRSVALGHVEAILSRMGGGRNITRVDDPALVYLTCFQVLQAAADPRSGQILQLGYDLLQDRASRIPDPSIRRSYLQNVPWNREIVAAWEALIAGDATGPGD